MLFTNIFTGLLILLTWKRQAHSISITKLRQQDLNLHSVIEELNATASEFTEAQRNYFTEAQRNYFTSSEYFDMTMFPEDIDVPEGSCPEAECAEKETCSDKKCTPRYFGECVGKDLCAEFPDLDACAAITDTEDYYLNEAACEGYQHLDGGYQYLDDCAAAICDAEVLCQGWTKSQHGIQLKYTIITQHLDYYTYDNVRNMLANIKNYNKISPELFSVLGSCKKKKARLYYNYSARGYCESYDDPHSLCTQHEHDRLAVCKDVDDHYYLPASCDFDCAMYRCDSERLCTGFVFREGKYLLHGRDNIVTLPGWENMNLSSSNKFLHIIQQIPCWRKDITYRQRLKQRCQPDDEQSNLCGSNSRDNYPIACQGVSEDGFISFPTSLEGIPVGRTHMIDACEWRCANEPDCAGFEEYVIHTNDLANPYVYEYKFKANIAIHNEKSDFHNCHVKEKLFQLGLRKLVSHDLTNRFPNYRYENSLSSCSPVGDATLDTLEACNAICAAGQCDADERCMGFTLQKEPGKEPVAILTSEVKSGTYGTGLECYRKLYSKECSTNAPDFPEPKFPERKSEADLRVDKKACNCMSTTDVDAENDEYGVYHDWDFTYYCGAHSGHHITQTAGSSPLDFVKLIPFVGDIVSLGDAVANLIKGVGSVGENVVDILLNTFTLTLSAATMGTGTGAAASIRAAVVGNKISMLTKIGGGIRKVARTVLRYKDSRSAYYSAMGDIKTYSDWYRTYTKGFSSIAVEGLNGCGPLLPTLAEISSDKWKDLNYAGWMEGVWTADYVMQRYRDPADDLTYNDIQKSVDQAIFSYINASRSKKDCASRVIANSVMHGVKQRFETCYTVTTKVIGDDPRTLEKTQAYNDLWKIGGRLGGSSLFSNGGCLECCFKVLETQKYWEPKYDELPLE